MSWEVIKVGVTLLVFAPIVALVIWHVRRSVEHERRMDLMKRMGNGDTSHLLELKKLSENSWKY